MGHVIPQTVQARSVVHGGGDAGQAKRSALGGPQLLKDDSLAAECSDPLIVATGRRSLRIDKPMGAYSQDDSAVLLGGGQDEVRFVDGCAADEHGHTS